MRAAVSWSGFTLGLMRPLPNLNLSCDLRLRLAELQQLEDAAYQVGHKAAWTCASRGSPKASISIRGSTALAAAGEPVLELGLAQSASRAWN